MVLLGLAALVISGCQKRSESSDDSGSAPSTVKVADGTTAKVGAAGHPDGAPKNQPQQEDPGERPEKPGPVPPCFPDPGPIAFKVNGVDVPKGAVDRFLAVWTARAPSMSEKTRLRKAIESGIIPVAAMYAKYRSDLPYLAGRAARIRKRLEAKEDWNKVVVEESHDPSRKVNLGSQGLRRQLGVPGLPPPEETLEDEAFRMKIDTFSKPLVTRIGLQIIQVTDEEKKPEPGQTIRNISRILVSYDAEYRKVLRTFPSEASEEVQKEAAKAIRVFIERFKRIIESARVEVVDQSYRPAIYPFRLKKP